jgi:hypothetical protein
MPHSSPKRRACVIVSEGQRMQKQNRARDLGDLHRFIGATMMGIILLISVFAVLAYGSYVLFNSR